LEFVTGKVGFANHIQFKLQEVTPLPL